VDVCAWLKDGADPDERDGSGATPLWVAVRGIEKALKPPLHPAGEALGQKERLSPREVTEVKLSRKARARLRVAAAAAEAANAQNEFAMHVDEHGGPVFQKLCRPATAQEADYASDTPRDECIRLLLEARASVDVLPITMETPLLIAALMGDTRRCAQLLAAKADPMACDREGRSVLDRATDPAVQELLQQARPECIRHPPLHEHSPWAFAATLQLYGVPDISFHQPMHNGFNQVLYQQAPPPRSDAKGRQKGKGKGSGGWHRRGTPLGMQF